MDLSETLVFLDGQKTKDPHLLVSKLRENETNVFETMRVYRLKIFRLDKHLDRLFASAKTIGISIPKTRESIKKELVSILRQIKNKREIFLRLMVMRGRTFVFVFHRSYPDRIYEEGVDLNTTVVKRNFSNAAPPEAKTGEFLSGILSVLDPSADGIFENLFLDRWGYLREARTANFFIVKNRCLKTPDATGILDGVTRRFVIECATKEEIGVVETVLTRHDVWNADEAFLTNTSGGLVPVRSLDGRQIGMRAPGPVTVELTRRFQIEYELEIQKNSHASH